MLCSILFSSLFSQLSPAFAASTVESGSYLKGTNFSDVYYVDLDKDGHLQRHAFINEQIFFTWQNNFDRVITVSDSILASLPLSTLVLPKPNVVLVKIQSDARTYIVDSNQELRWLNTESLATSLYGANWANYVIDLPPTIFPHFTRGLDVTSLDYSPDLSVLKTRSQLISTPSQSSALTTNNPIALSAIYTDPNSDARQQITAWAGTNPTDAAALEKIASQPVAKWFGDWNSHIENSVNNYITTATDAGALPVLVTYNIPNLGCYSSSGAASDADYLTWLTNFAAGLHNRPAVIILEPDATSASCVTTNRLALLGQTITILKSSANSLVYLDAGHANWVDATTMASRLTTANIAAADGFVLNVSNFYTNGENITYGTTISNLISNKHFIIDTSRNGNGSNGEWCNPSGRAIGQNPTTNTGNTLVDAYLWVKPPGESDGTCNGGPTAGDWWLDYALGLTK